MKVGEPTGSPTGPLNVAALASLARIVGFIGDDSRFETEGWDLMVREALRLPGFCWGNDGHKVPWASTVFVSKPIVSRLGWLALPSLNRGYFDVVWLRLAQETQSQRLIPAMFRHHNLPEGHPDGPSKETIEQDAEAYARWRGGQDREDVKTARIAIDLAQFFEEST